MQADRHSDWQKDSWRAEAGEWIRGQAARNGIEIDGPIEQPHLYPWSTVLHVPSNHGTLFFKATAPETIFEAALTEALSRWLPGCTPDLLGIEAERGWILMRDGGKQLRAWIRPNKDPAPWGPVVGLFAELQLRLIDRVPELLSLGVPDMRAEGLTPKLANILLDGRTLRLNEPQGLTSAELEEVHEALPRFSRACAELQRMGIPDTINHGDLTDGNVLVKDGRTTFFDWGDACVGHPFVSLRNVFVSIEIALDLDDYSFTPEMGLLLDIYLARWGDFAPREQLALAYKRSRWVASAVKALTWYSTVSVLQPPVLDEYEHIVPTVMKEFLHYGKTLDG